MHTPDSLIEGPELRKPRSLITYIGGRYMRERSGDFSDSTLAGRLGVIGLDTLVLAPAEISGINISDLSDEAAVRFVAIPQLAAGRENSANFVEFGQLHISDDLRNPISELVAVKPLPRARAVREFKAAQAINSRFGDRVSFRQIGFMKDTNLNRDHIDHITRYEHDVVSLDNVLWDKQSTSAQREHAMGLAGLWLASLHNHGVAHGDAQAKNIAFDSSGKPRFIDLDGASDLNDQELSPHTKRLLDVSDLFNPVYLKNADTDEQLSFIESYLEHQTMRQKLDGGDIQEAISSARESSSY